MPIPTRATRNTQIESELVHPRRVALHQRSASEALPANATTVAKSHQRTISTVIKPNIDSDGPSTASILQRKTPVKTATSSTARQPIQSVRQTNATVTKNPSLRRPQTTTTSSLQAPVSKPQFSTYQQHFSQKKLARPQSTGNDGASTEVSATQEVVRSPEVIHLQDELLQLHIIYGVSGKALQSYQESSREKLKARSEAVNQQHYSLIELEGQRNRCRSHRALEDWLEHDNNGNTHFDKLQVLATCVRDLETLTEDQGRLSQAIRKFEAWFEKMVLVQDARKNRSSQETLNLPFVEPIGPDWEEEVALIQHRLESCSGMLQSLGSASGGGIGYLLGSYNRLAANSYQEIKSCGSIYSLALQQEEDWLHDSVSNLRTRAATFDLPEATARSPEAPMIDRQGIWTNLV